MNKLLFLPLLLLAGCGSKTRMPYLGRWTGEWVVDSFVVGPNSPARRKAHTMAAELQLYATKNRFVMTLTGKQQTVEVEGEWTVRKGKNDLLLLPGRLKNDDRGGEDFRDPNLPFIPTDQLQKSLAAPFRLRPAGPKKLDGLPFAIGDAIGTYRLVSQNL